MISYPKRLIEVDLPIKRISSHARREKSIRHGHLSTLHLWWARRPLGVCRAVLCASLWIDPADENCPTDFIDAVKKEMLKWSEHNSLRFLSKESFENFIKVNRNPEVLTDRILLRHLLLDFIADFANWDNGNEKAFLETCRNLTASAHICLGGEPGSLPLVVDPFAGGGAIPFEALRVGAEAFASDLNPVPVLLNKVLLEYIPSYGKELLEYIPGACQRIEAAAKAALSPFFRIEDEAATPLAYIWGRTVISEAPSSSNIPIEIPLISSMWLSKKRNRGRALRWKRGSDNEVLTEEYKITNAKGDQILVLRPILEIFEPTNVSEVENGTTIGGAVTCPVSGFTIPVKNVRKQIASQNGGTAQARLLAVVTIRPKQRGRFYRIADNIDESFVKKAQEALLDKLADKEAHSLPTQLVPPRNSHRAVGSLAVYGFKTFSDLFLPRQLLVIVTLIECIDTEYSQLINNNPKIDPIYLRATRALLALMLSKLTDYNSSLATWSSPASQETVRGTFGRQTLAMVWDFAEANVFAPSSGGWRHMLNYFVKAVEHLVASNVQGGTVVKEDACNSALPDDVASCFFTDPPYYDSIPYAELSDYFYSWLKIVLNKSEPTLFKSDATPKDEQAIVWHPNSEQERLNYENKMQQAMAEGRRISKPNSIGIVVFAHKSTAGWESQLLSMVSAGWVVTASWPIDTERTGRTNANNAAALASSVHLICRPRESADGTPQKGQIGEWRDVQEELPKRIHEWMPRLAAEGVVGADAIFACLGPALEIFSRYTKVIQAGSEREIPLREYLEKVWAAVSQEALNMVFQGGEAKSLEEDARLTAMWLWTLTASDSTNGNALEPDGNNDTIGSNKSARYTIEFDTARKIAQGLGINLDDLRSLVELKGDKARLLSVQDRGVKLFGASSPGDQLQKRRKKVQLSLNFEPLDEYIGNKVEHIELKTDQIGRTVLDRLHQAMLLFSTGRTDALKRFLTESRAGEDERFWKLAQSLTALYPKDSDERRWVEAVQTFKKSLGF